MARARFNLPEIERALKEFQAHFPEINDKLEMRREEFTGTIVNNLMEGYAFLDDLQAKGIDLFSVSGLYNMLELNHIVLCGTSSEVRMEYYRYLQEARKSFVERMKPILKWFRSSGSALEPYRAAAEYYARALSFPQLFFEGNHRTENMVVNYYLANVGLPPYVIGVESAVEYLDVSARIKFSTAKGGGGRARVKHAKQFRRFLANYGGSPFLVQSEDNS